LLHHPCVGNLIGCLFRDTIPHRGCLIKTSNFHINPSTKAGLLWGTYERAEIDFVQRYLLKGLDVIELGASIGVVSTHIAKQLQPSRRLICVEANPHLVNLISLNVKRNAPNAHVITLHAALDYTNEKFVSFVIAKTNTGSFVGFENGNGIKVPRMTLTKICEMSCIREFCLVADIEGSELGIFRNEKALLEKCRQMIIELHDIKCPNNIVTVHDMVDDIRKNHGFMLVDSRGNVFVFQR